MQITVHKTKEKIQVKKTYSINDLFNMEEPVYRKHLQFYSRAYPQIALPVRTSCELFDFLDDGVVGDDNIEEQESLRDLFPGSYYMQFHAKEGDKIFTVITKPCNLEKLDIDMFPLETTLVGYGKVTEMGRPILLVSNKLMKKRLKID